MFYSQTFLARKGPLGTVWCAAHVQHRLNKSHYTATHIPSTVERIMFPEVPIALRMSGHLLLGVVRIYSKKIDYLYQDYNVLLIGISKAFDASTDVNLPKDATHAKPDDVTLPSPSKFALDELDMDEYNPERFHDNHRKSLEDITLTDQIPLGRDLFIAVNISEDVPTDSTPLEDAPGSGSVPMEKDSPPSTPKDATAYSGPSNQIGANERLHEDNLPEAERIRDVVQSEFMDDSLIFPDREDDRPILPDREDDVLEPDTVVLEELMRGKDIDTSNVEEIFISGGKPIPQQENQKQKSAPSEQGHNINGSPNAFADRSANYEIQPSPPAVQPRPRQRKRLFDEKTVMTNKFMKRALEDSRDLTRRRKDWCSFLGLWRLKNKQKQEKVFLEPVTTVRQEEALPEPNVAQPRSPVNDLDMEMNVEQPPLSPVNDFHVEAELLRNTEVRAKTNDIMSQLMNSTNRSRSSHVTRDDFTPSTSNGLGSHCMSERETPLTLCSEERLSLRNNGLYDIPELDKSGELSFLEEEDYTPIGLRGTPEGDYSSGKQRATPEVDSLSVRARAVAQYLKNKSSVTPISGDGHGDISLNTILDGKRRKICARMFFATLVLKNCGLVDVKQDETYGEINLKVTPKLSKEQFSN